MRGSLIAGGSVLYSLCGAGIHSTPLGAESERGGGGSSRFEETSEVPSHPWPGWGTGAGVEGPRALQPSFSYFLGRVTLDSTTPDSSVQNENKRKVVRG